MHQKSAHLDGQYAAFGKVIEGMDVVDEIANSQTNRQDRPNQEQKIQAMSVDLNGYDFQSPRIIEL
jgi:peptidyl-prolyl cis-trans isomerase B (cyclophilin B)